MPNSTAPLVTDETGQEILSSLENVSIVPNNIVDNLATQDASKVLSANMGYQIGNVLNNINNTLNAINETLNNLNTCGNLVYSLETGNNCSVVNNGIHVNGTDSDTYFYINIIGGHLEAGRYRFSWYTFGFANDSYYYAYRWRNMEGNPYLIAKNGVFSTIITVPTKITEKILIDDVTRNPAAAHAIIGVSITPIP